MGRVALLVVVAALAWAATPLGAKDGIPLPANPAAIFDARVAPHSLPRRGPAPVRFSISSRLETLEGDFRLVLREVAVAIDRQGFVDVTGLPTCGRRQLRSADTEAVEAACAEAIIGRGTGRGWLAYPENAPYPAESDLLAFNGGAKGHTITIYIRGRIPIPQPKAVIATVKVERIAKGPYGWLATAQIPPFADGYGFVTAFDLRFRRSYGFEGEKRSVFGAVCRDGTHQGRATFEFEGRDRTTAAILRTCTPKSRTR